MESKSPKIKRNEIHRAVGDWARSRDQTLVTDEKWFRGIFLNFRNQTSANLRLTGEGKALLCQAFPSFEIPRKTKPTVREILFLERTCRLPYFIDNNLLIIFEEELGVLLKMTEGNMDNLL